MFCTCPGWILDPFVTLIHREYVSITRLIIGAVEEAEVTASLWTTDTKDKEYGHLKSPFKCWYLHVL